MIKLRTILMALVGGLTLAAAQSAYAVATLTVNIKDAANVVIATATITDSDGDGVLVASGVSGGGYAISVTAASTKPFVGSAAKPEMDITVGASKFGGSGTGTYTAGNYVEIIFRDDNFTSPAPTLQTDFNSAAFPFGLTGSVKYDTFINDVTPLTTATQTTLSGTIGPINVQPPVVVGNYSLTQKLTLTAASGLYPGNTGGGTSISVDAHLETVPDGGFTLSLLGGSLLGLGMLRRKLQMS